MTIGTSLLHSLAQTHFSRLDDDISSLQAQIATGEADPRSSVDPVRALNMSATQDQKNKVEQFTQNLEGADNRLSMSDAVLNEVGDVMERLVEIGIRGGSGSAAETERASLLIEAQQLRDSLVSLAGSRDSTGKALFGGYQVEETPFVEVNGRVTYVGDTGEHSIRVSENANMPTGINGQAAFMDIRVDTEDGPITRDLFSMVDDLLYTLSPGGGARLDEAAASDSMRIIPGAATGIMSMQIDGPNGRAQIEAPYLAESPDAMIAAINAETANTGVSAVVDPNNPRAILLTGAGDIKLSNYEVDGGNSRAAKTMQVIPLVGGAAQDPITLVPKDATSNAMIKLMNTGLEHVADKQAEVGAIQQVGERYASALSKRAEMVEKALAGYQGLDIAKAVTELQALMLNRQAAQATYAQISGQTLFDFIG